MLKKNLEASPRFVAAVVRGLVTGRDFAQLADLTETVKLMIGRLHMRVSEDTITAAYRLISSNRPLVVPPARPTPGPAIHVVVSHAEACELLERLGTRPKAMR